MWCQMEIVLRMSLDEKLKSCHLQADASLLGIQLRQALAVNQLHNHLSPLSYVVIVLVTLVIVVRSHVVVVESIAAKLEVVLLLLLIKIIIIVIINNSNSTTITIGTTN